jgi:hypothetical protein
VAVVRRTSTSLEVVQAICSGCEWSSTARNALGNAARHHDATGHTVVTEQITRITYGDPNAPMPGQTRLVEA